MPLYEFICIPCGKRFEKLQRSEAEDAPACPACGSSEVKKQISVFSSAGASTSSSPSGCAPTG